LRSERSNLLSEFGVLILEGFLFCFDLCEVVFDALDDVILLRYGLLQATRLHPDSASSFPLPENSTLGSCWFHEHGNVVSSSFVRSRGSPFLRRW